MATENADIRDVHVGGRSYRIARFRGLKAQLILRLSAKISKRYPALATQVADFEQAYVDENKLRLSRTEAELRFGEDAARISDAAWETSGGEVAIKRMPSPYERFAAMWPELLEAAEEPALELLAVISLTNEELNAADDGDEIDKVIAERRKLLLHDGEAEEIVALVIAGVDVARGQFAPLVGKLEPLMAMIGLTMGEPGPTTSSTSQESQEPTDSPPPSSDSETSHSSSTDSPAATAGRESKSSEPPGSPSEPSPSD